MFSIILFLCITAHLLHTVWFTSEKKTWCFYIVYQTSHGILPESEFLPFCELNYGIYDDGLMTWLFAKHCYLHFYFYQNTSVTSWCKYILHPTFPNALLTFASMFSVHYGCDKLVDISVMSMMADSFLDTFYIYHAEYKISIIIILIPVANNQ